MVEWCEFFCLAGGACPVRKDAGSFGKRLELSPKRPCSIGDTPSGWKGSMDLPQNLQSRPLLTCLDLVGVVLICGRGCILQTLFGGCGLTLTCPKDLEIKDEPFGTPTKNEPKKANHKGKSCKEPPPPRWGQSFGIEALGFNPALKTSPWDPISMMTIMVLISV